MASILSIRQLLWRSLAYCVFLILAGCEARLGGDLNSVEYQLERVGEHFSDDAQEAVYQLHYDGGKEWVIALIPIDGYDAPNTTSSLPALLNLERAALQLPEGQFLVGASENSPVDVRRLTARMSIERTFVVVGSGLRTIVARVVRSDSAPPKLISFELSTGNQ